MFVARRRPRCNRVSIQGSPGNLNPQIAAKHATPRWHLAVKQCGDRRGKQGMIRRAAGHSKHPPVMKLALEFRTALDLKILLLG
jgi:hypothetical protein